ncbi:aminotransferase class IV family protein [Hydrogenimonas sp.]
MLFETICIQNGSIQHLSYHQARFDRSRSALFGTECEPLDLGSVIRPPTGTGILKCRVVYEREILDVSYHPYAPRRVRRLKMVESSLGYTHKFTDREALDELFEKRGSADDILIVRDGLVTDTSIANIAFFNGRGWVTPKTPLLRGTTRERLVKSGFLIPRDIRAAEIADFQKFALLNAMIGFEPVENGIIV